MLKKWSKLLTNGISVTSGTAPLLPHFTGLTDLKISTGGRYVDLSCLKNLQHVTITDLGIIKTSSKRAGFLTIPLLTSIAIEQREDRDPVRDANAESEKICNFLNLFPKITKLVTDPVPVVSNLTNLTSLTIQNDRYYLVEAKWFWNLTNLTTLRVRSKSRPCAQQLQAYSHLTQLTTFEMTGTGYIIPQIPSFPRLTDFSFKDNHNFCDDHFTHLTNLTNISLEATPSVTGSFLQRFTSLTSLEMKGFVLERDFFKYATNLSSFYAFRSEASENLKYLTNLTYLLLMECPGDATDETILSLPSLEHLRIENAGKISSDIAEKISTF